MKRAHGAFGPASPRIPWIERLFAEPEPIVLVEDQDGPLIWVGGHRPRFVAALLRRLWR